MWIADGWTEYRVLDASDGEKLEDWGGYLLIRPDPQVIWSSGRRDSRWKKPNAHYHRSSRGGGSWEFFSLPDSWDIHYALGCPERTSEDPGTNYLHNADAQPIMTFHLKPFAFKHTGVFPEQSVNWEFSYRLIRERLTARRGNASKTVSGSAEADGAANPVVGMEAGRADLPGCAGIGAGDTDRLGGGTGTGGTDHMDSGVTGAGGAKHPGRSRKAAKGGTNNCIYSKSGDTAAAGASSAPAVRVLNLFAYTGGATMAAALAGAEVVHVDASKGMVSWARENAASSGLANAPIRWIVDDCRKFVEREIRRGRKYDAIIMDPPSYGRGPGGEVWKMEESIFPFLKLCAGVLSDNPLFVILNSYTTGLQPGVLEYMLTLAFGDRFPGAACASEIGLPVCGGALRGASGLQMVPGLVDSGGTRRGASGLQMVPGLVDFGGARSGISGPAGFPERYAHPDGTHRGTSLILPEGAAGRFYNPRQ